MVLEQKSERQAQVEFQPKFLFLSSYPLLRKEKSREFGYDTDMYHLPLKGWLIESGSILYHCTCSG
ncbi:hypothetical protein A9239_05775 [Methanosarcina sp. A14]|nr:hypothetical protein A9239_05775 [Methanosarcina sp. A14]